MIDKSHGYDEHAEAFMSRRRAIGASTVREWRRALPPGASVLDLACGHGVPISEFLVEAGVDLYAVDASEKMTQAFRARFPGVPAQCAAAEDSDFFGRTFDGVVCWGLMFLLPAGFQEIVIRRVAAVLNPGGRFLFTSPRDAVTWQDVLTERESISLGLEAYEKILTGAGLVLSATATDEGSNFYFLTARP